MNSSSAYSCLVFVSLSENLAIFIPLKCDGIFENLNEMMEISSELTGSPNCYVIVSFDMF